MKCVYCNLLAISKCNCNQPYMCENHLGKHLIAKKNHDFELLDIELGEFEHKQLKTEILKKLQQLRKLKLDLNLKTNWLINQIEGLLKDSLELLNSITRNLIEILQHKKFCVSEIATIEQFSEIEFQTQNIEFNEIRHEIEKLFPKDVKFQEGQLLIMGEKAYEEEQKRQRRQMQEKQRREDEERQRAEELERQKRDQEKIAALHPERSRDHLVKTNYMDVKLKINYFHPILKTHWVFENINSCYDKIKEMQVSNDGKFLFVCTTYVDNEWGRI